MVGAVRDKVVTLDDAVEFVQNGDTISVSGFVTTGAPEYLLEGLAERFIKTGVM